MCVEDIACNINVVFLRHIVVYISCVVRYRQQQNELTEWLAKCVCFVKRRRCSTVTANALFFFVLVLVFLLFIFLFQLSNLCLRSTWSFNTRLWMASVIYIFWIWARDHHHCTYRLKLTTKLNFPCPILYRTWLLPIAHVLNFFAHFWCLCAETATNLSQVENLTPDWSSPCPVSCRMG